jgi:hypothetical protein
MMIAPVHTVSLLAALALLGCNDQDPAAVGALDSLG